MLYVDCDSHILPEDAFDEVAPEFRARGPRLVADEKGVRVVYEARQKNIPDYARHIPNPFNPRPRVPGDDPAQRVADLAMSITRCAGSSPGTRGRGLKGLGIWRA